MAGGGSTRTILSETCDSVLSLFGAGYCTSCSMSNLSSKSYFISTSTTSAYLNFSFLGVAGFYTLGGEFLEMGFFLVKTYFLSGTAFDIQLR